MKKVILVAPLIALLVLPVITNALTLQDIKSLATSPQPGDTVLVWVPGGFWNPPVEQNGIIYQNCTWPGQLITMSDGRTVWIEPNYWNIANAQGENYMRFIKSSEQVVFYAVLSDVSTQWGGIAWATPAVVIAGRAPPQFAQLPSAGGYSWFSLPVKTQEFLGKNAPVYVKLNYEVVKRDDTMVRAGLLMWFEDSENGGARAEVYIAFHDDFGGWVGDKTIVKTMNVPMIVNGQPVTGVFEVQRALSGGGWAAMVFLLKNSDVLKGEVYIDLAPFVGEVFNQLVNFFELPADRIVWSDVRFSTYFGSQGTAAELGWILYDARLVPPELVPRFVTVTQTQTQVITTTTTKTETSTVTTTLVNTQTSIVTQTQTVTALDYVTVGVVGVVGLVIGLGLGMVVKGKKK
jgi:hypothetical protein